jgi:adenosylmethionine-8-amino-7-oxononanoate aminotransferase
MPTLAELDHAHLWHPFTQQKEWVRSEPLIIERAEGNFLIDIHGKRYLDGVSSLWTNVHGHRVPAIDHAIKAQLDRVAHSTMLGLSHPSAIELARRLVVAAPGQLNRVFFSDNGSTATEVALKMAFQYQQQIGQTKRTRFASLKDAYHGDTLGAVSVGAIDLFHEVYRPLLFDAVALPAPTRPGGTEEADCLQRALTMLDTHGDTLAAVIVEPLVQGAAGMKMHSPNFLRAICDKAHQVGALVAIDEVATGFGRTGTLFATEQAGVSPDFLCLAKGIAGGYLPLAATLATEQVYEAFLDEPERFKQFFHGHTFTANPLACAAALASLHLFDENQVLDHVQHIAKTLHQGLMQMAPKRPIRSIRQTGVMVGIDLDDDTHGAGHRAAMRAREHGVILRPLGNTLVINPPLSLSEYEAQMLLGATRRALKPA